MLKDTSLFLEENMLNTIKAMFASFSNTIDIKNDILKIDAQELPFVFIIRKCPSLGWSVFLQPKSNDISTNETIDKLYQEIDLYLGSINLSDFNMVEEDQDEMSFRLNTLTSTLETLRISPVTHHISQKSPGILQVSYEAQESHVSPFLEIGYSRIFQRWDFDLILGENEPCSVNQLRKEILNRATNYLITWNLPLLGRS